MATTFTVAKRTLDLIAAKVETADNRLKQARDLIAQAESELSALQTTYSTVISDINAAATANPDDPAWQAAKAEKDLMVTDFQALKAKATNLKNAYDSV